MICIKCHSDKPSTEYYLRGDDKTKYLKQCKSCQKLFAKLHREKYPNQSYKSYIKRRYNINPSVYFKLLKENAGRCAICFKLPKGRLVIDHNHQKGNIRSLLCRSCNALIGFALEDVSILQSAIKYLMKHNTCYRKLDGYQSLGKNKECLY